MLLPGIELGHSELNYSSLITRLAKLVINFGNLSGCIQIILARYMIINVTTSAKIFLSN